MQLSTSFKQCWLILICGVYIFFFTQSLPIFWEGHQFHEGFAQQSVTSLIKQTFSFSGNILQKAEPGYGLYFKLVFSLVHYNFAGFRIAKVIVFTITAILLFKLLTAIFTRKEPALLTTFVIMTSFPVYIHTMVLDESFIIAELFKFAALLIFLKDLHKPTTSLFRQLATLLFAILAFKTYPPTGMLIPFIAVFTALFYRPLFTRYAIIFTAVGIMIFPFSNIITGTVQGPFGLHFENIRQIFLTGLRENILSPFTTLDFSNYTFRGLYWKPFPFIVTFFGFLTFFFSLAIIIFQKKLRAHYPEQHENPFRWTFQQVWWFCVLWMLFELPIFIFIPEPALRYTSAFITPFFILVMSYALRARSFLPAKHHRATTYYLYATIFFIISVNLMNTFFFRALLGSDVIAMDKVSQIIEPTTNACIVYVPTYIADQYLLLNTTNLNYTIRTDIQHIKATHKEEFQTAYFKTLKPHCSRLFVVQQKSITRGTLFPPIQFDRQENMHLVRHIVGEDGTLFDTFVHFLQTNGIINNLYNEYYLWEYRKA